MSSEQSLSAATGAIDRARAAGVQLWFEGENLRFRAPQGALTDQLRTSIRELRAEVVAALRKEAEDQVTIGPLAENQHGLWFLHQLAPSSTAYHLASAIQVHGDLDAAAFEQSLQILVDRHESLRTSFLPENGGPTRRIHGYRRMRLHYIDATDWSEERRMQSLRTEYAQPFNLETGPLIRVYCYREAADRHVVLLTAHHIALDGTSILVFMEELGEAYSALTEGKPMPARTDLARYEEFVQWHHAHIEDAHAEGQYWTEVVTPTPPPLGLPTSFPRPRTPRMRGASIRHTLNPAVVAELRTLARNSGVTDFVLLLSLWVTLLHRLTGQTDITVGAPVNGRPSARFARTIGHFVNVLPLRLRDIDGLTFTDLLARVRTVVLDGLARQDYPLSRMVQQADNRSVGAAPFQTIFVLQDFIRFEQKENLEPAAPGLRLGALSITPIEFEQQSGQSDLSLEVLPRGDRLNCTWHYDTDLFEQAVIESWTRSFTMLAAAVVADGGALLADLPLISAHDWADIEQWNATDRAYDLGTTLHALIEAQAVRTPNAVAVSSPESGVAKELSFRELNRRANALAVRLQTLGVGRDTPVAVCMERSAELVVALLAVLKAGGAYVPVDPGYPAERRTFMLEDCGAPVVLTQSALAQDAVGATVISVDNIWSELDIDAQPERRADPESLAYIIYTSGSTGRPKGAMIEHRSIVNRVIWMQEHFGLDSADVVLQKTPYSFDVSVWEFFWPLMTGARLVMAKPEGHKDPGYLESLIHSERVTTAHFVPSMLHAFLENVHADLPSLKRVICSGEALSTAVRDRFFEVFQRTELTNLYGPTEAAVDVSWYRCSANDATATVPIGWPVANTQLYILDERLRQVPVGVPGELYIGGVQVGRGYLNRPELTAERFVADPFNTGGRLYRTGDRARFLANGAIEFLGRLDHQVKVRGFRIELGEIEARLLEHADVRDAVVVARDERLIGYIVGGVAVEDLRRWVGMTLPDYMVPSVFMLMDALPLSPNGKLDRKALPQPGAMDRAAPGTTPATDTEIAIAAIWSEVLGVRNPLRENSFFEIGGHSLLAVRLTSAVRARFGIELPLADVFQSPTLAAFASRVDDALQSQSLIERTSIAHEVFDF